MPRIKDETGGLKILGGGSMPQVASGPDASLLEHFPNRFPDRLYMVTIAFPEYTSLCPVTGQPDFGTIVVEYVPDRLCVESKSFKLYMFAYRQSRSFMETITNSILSDLCACLSPCWCRVKGLFAPRGGARIHVFAEQYKELPPEKLNQVHAFTKSWLAQPNPHWPE